MKLEAMLWILVFVSVALAIASPRCRPYSLIVAAAMIVTIVGVVVVANRVEPALASLPPVTAVPSIQQSRHADFEQLHIEKLDKEDPDGKNRIAIEEITLDQIRPELGSEPGTIRLISALLHNHSSRYLLTDYAYYLEIQDCVQTRCTTVYDQYGQAAVSVPPNEARDVVIMIHDGDTRGIPTFKIVGRPSIKLSPTDTRGYQSVTTPAR